MKYLLLLALTSCSLTLTDQPVASLPKQRQKIAVLEKKLERAALEERKAKTEVDLLSASLQQAQLSLIRKQIESFQASLSKLDPLKRATINVPNLFLKERETLHQMIRSGPSTTSYEAQTVLDSILELITLLSDD